MAATLVAAGAAALVVVTPGSASAAIVGLTTASGQTASNSSSSKTLDVPCPNGTTALGGDMQITGNNQVRILAIYPQFSFVRFRAAEPAEGVSAAWSFSATAVCAPQSSLPGYAVVTGGDTQTVLDGGETVRVNIERVCPNNKVLVGMGGSISSGFDFGANLPRTRLSRIASNNGGDVPTSYRIDGSAGGYDGTVELNGIGICADSTQVSVRQFSNRTNATSVNAKNVSVPCFSPTGTVITAGFTVLEEFGTTADFNVSVTSVGVSRLTNTVGMIARESAPGTEENWQLIGQALCT
ncbi:hypothetical protein ACTMTJ_32210 [Phytohabitans sp. LJ34]|uniref:hypothetical protein n=1 Tax=Phytohabitans sp. LJ34 TaxID=3452217 RepID=UPI003F89EF4C